MFWVAEQLGMRHPCTRFRMDLFTCLSPGIRETTWLAAWNLGIFFKFQVVMSQMPECPYHIHITGLFYIEYHMLNENIVPKLMLCFVRQQNHSDAKQNQTHLQT